MNLLVRTSGNPVGLTAPIRPLIVRRDNDTVASIITMDESAVKSNEPTRHITAVIGTMAMFARLLATIGVCAVTAFSVSRRSQETETHMAPIAQRGKALLLVMCQGMGLSLLARPIQDGPARTLPRFPCFDHSSVNLVLWGRGTWSSPDNPDTGESVRR